MKDDDPIHLEDDEFSIYSLMSALRSHAVRLSGSLVERVTEGLDRAAAERRAGHASMVGGLLVEMCNIVCEIVGVADEADDGDTDLEEGPEDQ